jgi:hypothetical protein
MSSFLLHSSDSVLKYGTARYGKHDNTIHSMCFPFYMGKAREKYSELYRVLDKAIETHSE